MMILGRNPVVGGQASVRVQVLRIHDMDRHSSCAHSRHPPAKRPLVPDSAWILRSRSQVESTLGGFTANSRPGSVGPSLGPCLPSTLTYPSLPLTASTVPSAICRWVFTTSKGRVRVAATWRGGDRARLHSQAPQEWLTKASRLPSRHHWGGAPGHLCSLPLRVLQDTFGGLTPNPSTHHS